MTITNLSTYQPNNLFEYSTCEVGNCMEVACDLFKSYINRIDKKSICQWDITQLTMTFAKEKIQK
jgi:hypothetical protein